MARKSLPPGFRFHPTDVELVLYYLKRKVMGKKLHYEAIAEVNIYKFSPWDLPDRSCLKSKDLEWFFFCPIEKKYARGVRVKRATENGFWKTTGKDRTIIYNEKTVGAVKTLVFHLGNTSKGERTDWVIHEYRILDDDLAAAGVQDTYVLCKVFKKNGPGPKNGAQYGAPFNEADWADNDTVGAEDHCVSLTSNSHLLTALMQTVEHGSPPERGMCAPGNMSGLPLHEESPSPSAGGPTSEVAANVAEDEILHLLASFTDEDMLLSNENGINQDDLSGKGMNELVPCSDGHDMFSDLGDLDTWGKVNEGRLDSSEFQNDEYNVNGMLFQDNSTFLELDDLLPPLDLSNEPTVADQSSLCLIIGAPGHENMQQLYSGASSGPYPSCLDELPLPPQGSYEIDNISNVLQMDDHQIYLGSNAPYNLAFGIQESAVYLSNLERGSRLLVDLLEFNPAHRCLPTVRSGGSSIHIKAEVTHGAGECTNEALSVMMGGSGSCWCTLLPCAVFFILPLLVVDQLSKAAAIIEISDPDYSCLPSLVGLLCAAENQIYGVAI